MPTDSAAAFSALRSVLASYADRLSVTADTPGEYTLMTKSPSPFRQHKGQPLFFGSVRTGKAYVSFHLLPLYMCPELNNGISEKLQKRKQGKACFNFKNNPDPELLDELKRLTGSGLSAWSEKKWL